MNTLPPIHKPDIPGLFITSTDTDVGKTIVAGAIAHWFLKQDKQPAVLKPVASGCEKRREGLVSADSEFLAHCSNTRHPLDLICPNRYALPVAPAIAAQQEKQPMDWEAVDRSIKLMSPGADLMIVEGAGGVLVPIDNKYLMIDMIAAFDYPTVVVARPSLGTINQTLLTIEALRARKIKIAGVVINRYPMDNVGLAEETSPRQIEKWGKVPILCIVPQEPFDIPTLGKGIVAAINQVDWEGKLR